MAGDQPQAVSLPDIVATLQRAIEIAEEDRNPNAMAQAVLGQAKVMGLIVQRTDLTIKPLELWTPDELAQLLGDKARDIETRVNRGR